MPSRLHEFDDLRPHMLRIVSGLSVVARLEIRTCLPEVSRNIRRRSALNVGGCRVAISWLLIDSSQFAESRCRSCFAAPSASIYPMIKRMFVMMAKASTPSRRPEPFPDSDRPVSAAAEVARAVLEMVLRVRESVQSESSEF